METKIKMVGFEYEKASIVREISRNISVLISTPAGTCAGDRNYGIDGNFIGQPLQIAENLLAIELMEKIPAYEPRADVLEVSCAADLTGQLVATILIGPNDSYDPEEENGDGGNNEE